MEEIWTLLYSVIRFCWVALVSLPIADRWSDVSRTTPLRSSEFRSSECSSLVSVALFRDVSSQGCPGLQRQSIVCAAACTPVHAVKSIALSF